MVFGGMNRKDWTTVSVDDVDYDGLELARQLGSTLRARTPRDRASLTAFGTQLVEELRKALSALLPTPERPDLHRARLRLNGDSRLIAPEKRRAFAVRFVSAQMSRSPSNSRIVAGLSCGMDTQ